MSKRIEPRILKGFRDYLPEEALLRRQMLETVVNSFTLFGFSPIDTPALEYSEILLGSGSAETDKQLYRFHDNGDRDVALRFDLTIPLARFVARNVEKLSLPFRRYHIAPVWRAEKPQRGRFREFMQCDIDIIGARSAVADSEIVAAISSTLDKLNLNHTLRINSRELSNAWFKHLGIDQQTPAILRALDKIDKTSQETVVSELEQKASLNKDQISEVFKLTGMKASSNSEVLFALKQLLTECPALESSIIRLEQTLELLTSFGVKENQAKLDLSIARGLDYYTGIVFETDLVEKPAFGSIASGGRYDNLASSFSKKELPGVGASIGLDRILAALMESETWQKQKSLSQLVVFHMGEPTLKYGALIATSLRNFGINIEFYPEATKLAAQFKYAEKKGIRYALIAGQAEEEKGVFSIKDLIEGEQHNDLSLEDAKRILLS